MSRIKGLNIARPADVPEGSVVSVFRVPLEQEGMRLDRFLHGQLRRTSRTRTQMILRNSGYDEHGRRLKPNDRARTDTLIVLWRPPWDEDDVPSEIPIVYEDEHLLVVSKPALLPVHPTARYHKNTLIKKLQAARPTQWLSLGHRLDRETSGLLIVAKSPECDRLLKKKFEARDNIEKVYDAMTWGIPAGFPSRMTPGQTVPSIRCDAPLRLDPTSSLSVKVHVSYTEDAQAAGTVFELRDLRQNEVGRQYARIRCTLETGRQHQIRVHLMTLGAPIVGDKLYGPDERMFARAADGELTEEDETALEIGRHALHAAEMRLDHPVTGAALDLRAELPADLRDFWAELRASN
jgi:23S rRNA pseudouridine1911/1915/1917 synthase